MSIDWQVLLAASSPTATATDANAALNSTLSGNAAVSGSGFSAALKAGMSQVPTPIEWWRLLFLGIIFAGLFGLWWWINRGSIDLKKFDLKNFLKPQEPKIKVEDQRWLNSRCSVVLLQVEGEKFLLAQNHNGVSWQRLTPSPLVADPSPVNPLSS